jgi:hypothetical protein
MALMLPRRERHVQLSALAMKISEKKKQTKKKQQKRMHYV